MAVPASVTKFLRNANLAVRGLWLHKLRSFLSVLGIIIGTASIIALMAFGSGSMREALIAIKQQGATNVIARSTKPPDDSSTARRTFIAVYGLTTDDYEQFQTISAFTQLVPMRVFNQEARRGAIMHNARLVGTTAGYASVNRLEMAVGRFLNDEDEEQIRNVAVLGSNTAEVLFPFGEAEGKTIAMSGHNFQVIGILKSRIPTAGGGGSQAAEDFNNDIYIPLSTSRRRLGETVFIRTSGQRGGERVKLNQITMTVDADVDTKEGREKVKAAGKIVEDILAKNHFRKDYSVTVPLDRLEQAEETERNFRQLLGMIASISLLVGGIGIMNIMLATVTERTREIGIRRALGAKKKDIIMQFLVEAVVQTSIGGVLGILLGLTLALGLPPLSEWIRGVPLPSALSWEPVVLSFSASVIVGVLSGLYPAYRAARLDPIEALRHV